MMKLARTLFATLAILLGVTVAAVNQDVVPASASLASCVSSPGSLGTGSYYSGSLCNSASGSTRPFHYTIARCQYRALLTWHTYTVTGPPAADGNWSWAYCGAHLHDQVGQIPMTTARTGPYQETVIDQTIGWAA